MRGVCEEEVREQEGQEEVATLAAVAARRDWAAPHRARLQSFVPNRGGSCGRRLLRVKIGLGAAGALVTVLFVVKLLPALIAALGIGAFLAILRRAKPERDDQRCRDPTPASPAVGARAGRARRLRRRRGAPSLAAAAWTARRSRR